MLNSALWISVKPTVATHTLRLIADKRLSPINGC